MALDICTKVPCGELTNRSQFPGKKLSPDPENKTSKIAVGQHKLDYPGVRAVSEPSVFNRSAAGVKDGFLRRPTRSVQLYLSPTPTLTQPDYEASCFGTRNITVDDYEFCDSGTTFFRQFLNSYRNAIKINNPNLDRSELTEMVRHRSFQLFFGVGCCATFILVVVGFNAFLNFMEETLRGTNKKPMKQEAVVEMWIFLSFVIVIVLTLLTPDVRKLSFIPTAIFTAFVDAREKKRASTDKDAQQRFIEKFKRMESLLFRLEKLRHSKSLPPAKFHPREYPRLSVSIIDNGVGALRKVIVVEHDKPRSAIEKSDISFGQHPACKNRTEVEEAIFKTRAWLKRAEKQMRLICEQSSTVVDTDA